MGHFDYILQELGISMNLRKRIEQIEINVAAFNVSD